MSITLTPTKASYLERVSEGLSDLPNEDREEVLQDLEAHLAELDDAEIQRTLGDAASFVIEFRASAGLDEPFDERRWEVLRALGERYADFSARLSGLTRWPTLRPGWVVIRGWVLVVAWSFLYDYEQFSRFPIPSVGSSSLTGLFLVVLVTGISIWSDRRQERPFRFASTTLSFLAVWGLIASFLNAPIPETYEEIPPYAEQLVGPEGNVITNIYAYDLEGKPVEVLLFDQDGRPVLTFTSYVYDEANLDPSTNTFDHPNGTVTFTRDQFGRIIPNLYPLEMSTINEYGELAPMTPPFLGFAQDEESTPPADGVEEGRS
jgi:hypothetical protein